MPNKPNLDLNSIKNWIIFAATIFTIFSGGMMTEDIFDFIHFLD